MEVGVPDVFQYLHEGRKGLAVVGHNSSMKSKCTPSAIYCQTIAFSFAYRFYGFYFEIFRIYVYEIKAAAFYSIHNILCVEKMRFIGKISNAYRPDVVIGTFIEKSVIKSNSKTRQFAEEYIFQYDTFFLGKTIYDFAFYNVLYLFLSALRENNRMFFKRSASRASAHLYVSIDGEHILLSSTLCNNLQVVRFLLVGVSERLYVFLGVNRVAVVEKKPRKYVFLHKYTIYYAKI